MSYINDALDYLSGLSFNVEKESNTANGDTDQGKPANETQSTLENAATTDARSIANAAFGNGVLIPAEIIAAGDAYDITQAKTRINKLYATTREAFYQQGTSAVNVRQNRYAHKQNLIAESYRQSVEPKKAQAW